MNDCHTITEPITPIQVRDSIIRCFNQAHKKLIEESVDMPAEKKELFSEKSILNIIKSQFKKIEADFDNPTKESLFFVIIGLADIAKNFRNIDEIVRNFLDILHLIDRL